LETALYLPVKRFLEAAGLTVKGEIRGCDLVALDGAQPAAVVIGELKETFTLELVLQAVERTAMADEVWLAVRASKRGRGREGDARVKKLCRFLGFGLMAVTAAEKVEVLVEPVPWKPRPNAKKRSKIIDEHRRRRGDPALGGSSKRPIMTAYRQQALGIAAAIGDGTGRPRDLKTDFPDAAKILQGNVYGWFDKIDRGTYRLSDAGRAGLTTWAEHVPERAVDGGGQGIEAGITGSSSIVGSVIASANEAIQTAAAISLDCFASARNDGPQPKLSSRT
jgi:hypothetical protein